MSDEAVVPPVVAPVVATPDPVAAPPPVVPPAEPVSEIPETVISKMFESFTAKPDKPAATPAPAAPPEPKKPKEVVKPADPAVADPAEPPAPKPRKTTKYIATQPKGLEVADVAEIAATAAARAVADLKPAAKPAEPAVALPEMFRTKADIFAQLERLYPEKYGNGKLVSMAVDSTKKIKDYQTSWESENPGQKFVAKDHEDEIADLAPDIPEDDIMTARVDIAAAKRIAPFEEAERQRQAKEQSRQAVTELTPVAQQAANRLGDSIAREIDPKFAELMRTGDQAKIREHRTAHPEEFDLIQETYKRYEGKARLTAQLLAPKGALTYDEANPTHRAVFDQFVAIEDNFDGKPDGHGKHFVTNEKYGKMTNSQRAGYRTVDVQVVQAVLAGDAAREAKSYITARNKYKESVIKEFIAKNPQHQVTAAAESTVPGITPAGTSRAVGGSLPGEGAAVGAASAAVAGGTGWRDQLFKNLMG